MLGASVREDDYQIREIQNLDSHLIVELDSEMMIIEASKSLELDVDVVAHKKGTKVVVQLVERDLFNVFLIDLE